MKAILTPSNCSRRLLLSEQGKRSYSARRRCLMYATVRYAVCRMGSSESRSDLVVLPMVVEVSWQVTTNSSLLMTHNQSQIPFVLTSDKKQPDILVPARQQIVCHRQSVREQRSLPLPSQLQLQLPLDRIPRMLLRPQSSRSRSPTQDRSIKLCVKRSSVVCSRIRVGCHIKTSERGSLHSSISPGTSSLVRAG